MLNSKKNHDSVDFSSAPRQPEVVIATLVRFDDGGAPLVDWPGNPHGAPVRALSTAAYSAADVGRSAALLFAGGDVANPLIVGLIRERLDDVISATADSLQNTTLNSDISASCAQVDGERIVMTAEREIMLKCGKASITLTRAGKIVIRGEYVLSRSSKANRIKGGSVQLN